jgi:hypothetical protein
MSLVVIRNQEMTADSQCDTHDFKYHLKTWSVLITENSIASFHTASWPVIINIWTHRNEISLKLDQGIFFSKNIALALQCCTG